MPVITGVQITELGEAVVSFDVAVDIDEASTGQIWNLEPVNTNAAASSVYDAEVLPGALLVKVWFSPPLSPDQDYTITASPGGVDTSFVFTTPNLQKELGDEWYHGPLRAITRAAGQVVQELSGRPVTILTQDIAPNDTHLFVESTLGFPDSGYVLVGDREYAYSSKKPSSFRSVSVDEELSLILSARQLAVVNVAKILPYRSRFFLDASGDGSNGIL